MTTPSSKTRFIGPQFLGYLAVFFGWINLYLNDKLRAEMEDIEEKNRRKEKFKEIHDRNAGSYEKKTEFAEFRNQINKYRRILISHAKGRVLEMGVGTGRSLEFYKRDIEELICVDHSKKMLQLAILKGEDKKENRIELENINFLVMDNEDLTFEDNSFDTVVDFNNFQSYNNYKKVIDNAKRVLRNDGEYIIMAKGESNYKLIRDFYTIFKPFFFMKHGCDYNKNWSEVFEKDNDFEVVYKSRRNFGKSYLYILKLKKNKI